MGLAVDGVYEGVEASFILRSGTLDSNVDGGIFRLYEGVAPAFGREVYSTPKSRISNDQLPPVTEHSF